MDISEGISEMSSMTLLVASNLLLIHHSIDNGTAVHINGCSIQYNEQFFAWGVSVKSIGYPKSLVRFLKQTIKEECASRKSILLAVD